MKGKSEARHAGGWQLDTLKTRVQSAAGASIGSVVRSVPDIGLRGLYRRAAALPASCASCGAAWTPRMASLPWLMPGEQGERLLIG